MKKTCPKCQLIFECQTENIAKCQCNTILLDDAQRAELQATYNNCLCISCLKSIAKQTNSTTIPNQYLT